MTENTLAVNKTDSTIVPDEVSDGRISTRAAFLDDRIRAHAAEFGQLAMSYIRLGAYLVEMKQTNGFKLLGFKSWEHYLDSLNLSRSYLSLMLKLGLAGDLQGWVERGLTTSHLIEYAKAVSVPEKIPEVIEATFEQVVSKPIRVARQNIGHFVEVHPGYRRVRAPNGKLKGPAVPEAFSTVALAAPPGPECIATIQSGLYNAFQQLPVLERSRFTAMLEAVVAELRDSA